MQTTFKTALGSYEIRRLPQRKQELLRAWDAADEYLLEYLHSQGLLNENSRLLIINDSFGALAVALHRFHPFAVSDSWLSQQATQLNLETNKLNPDTVQLHSCLHWPTEKFDLLLIKIPKTMALLEYQLIQLQQQLSGQTKVIAAAMVKGLPASAWKLMEKYLGPTTPSLAQKKARLIFVEIDSSKKPAENPYPVYYQLENTAYKICNHANVFSRDSLDIGTRFLLQHLPQQSSARDIVDLGCGNGVVGLLLAETHPDAQLHFVDESFMAVASAKDNFCRAFAERQASYYTTDGLTEFSSQSMDLIVCNPPFHQHNTVGTHIAVTMFKQARRVLKPGGSLWVIGNRHLNYHIVLKKLFGQLREVAANKKFIIWQVEK